MSSGITLQDRQSLVGSGGPFEVNTRFGTIEIPPQTAILPLVTNGGVDSLPAVTLTNQNTISGLAISVTGDPVSGIFGDGVNGVLVQHCTIASASATVFSFGIEFIGSTQGDLIFRDLTISTFSEAGGSAGIYNEELFSGGDVLFENLTISSITNTDISIGGAIVFDQDFAGRNFICRDSNVMGSHLGVAFFDFLQGNFICQNNSIFTERKREDDDVGGAILLGSFFNDSFFQGGDVVIEHNTIRSLESSAIQIPHMASNARAIIQNNNVTGNDHALFVGSDSGSFSFHILNNSLSSITDEAVSVGTSGAVDVRYWKNTSFAQGAPSDVLFDESGGGLLQVESPNLSLSGVEALGEGSILAPGVTFIPFE